MSFNRQLEDEPKKPDEEEMTEDLDLEKEDLKAMFVAALITFLPVVILFVGALYLIIYLLFLR
ncbi:MAG: hypothetical protein GX778_05935 [Erysipelothrix sp.]|nr:hypothetical protein [Erysipelothrix sp.]